MTVSKGIFQIFLILLVAYGLTVFIQKRDTDGSLKQISPTSVEVHIPKKKRRKSKKSSITIHKKQKTYKGFTLQPVNGTAEVLLLDMDGKIVHFWNVDASRTILQPNGNIVVLHGSKWGKKVEPWRSLRNTITEYDWRGDVVWSFSYKEELHHDLTVLPNGNILTLTKESIPPEFKFNIYDLARRTLEIKADVAVELSRDKQVVWRWDSYRHLDLNDCGVRDCVEATGTIASAIRIRDWAHINTVRQLQENIWHQKGDNRFKPGNFMIMARNFWTAMIVDRDTGDVVWKYSGDYRGGLGGGHEAHMIPKGLPGEGNILIFDNGVKHHAKESIIIEVNPITKKVVWSYEDGKNFFSRTRGSVQRLPNGNTLISEDNKGRVFEVTSSCVRAVKS